MDIEQAVKLGNIIEDYPNDPRGASCLIFGRAGDRPLHILFAQLQAEELLVVTAYEPIRKSGRTIGRQERPGDFMITECYFCKGKVVAVKTEVDFRWGKKLKVLKDVPARVCQQCGEKYFEATIYKAMERLVIRRVKPSARMSVDVVQFKEAV